MVLTLSSKKFIFERGAGLLIPRDFGQAGMEAWIDRTNAEGLRTLVNNTMERGTLPHAGEFLLMLGDVTVQRTTDHFMAVIPFFITNVQISEEDLNRDRTEVTIEPEGIFRLTIIDRAQQPIPKRRLNTFPCFLKDEAGSEGMEFWSSRIQADEHGSLFFLGNPFAWWIELDSETGLQMTPV